jgi:mannose-1-phosphate guanylyltransferase / mannose-6-phosphate isomerase
MSQWRPAVEKEEISLLPNCSNAWLHHLCNPGKIPPQIIEVQPDSYLGEDDIERFEDIYGRSTPIERGVSVKTIAQ